MGVAMGMGMHAHGATWARARACCMRVPLTGWRARARAAQDMMSLGHGVLLPPTILKEAKAKFRTVMQRQEASRKEPCMNARVHPSCVWHVHGMCTQVMQRQEASRKADAAPGATGSKGAGTGPTAGQSSNRRGGSPLRGPAGAAWPPPATPVWPPREE